MKSFKDCWAKLLCDERMGLEKKYHTSDKTRTPFMQDIDRLIFSTSFRRLGKKTQVHPLVENDHIHTRLSHSLEVASVGRSLGCLAGQFLKEKEFLPENITPWNIGEILQAACLAHDIGNPPFGHAGEEAIRSWFQKNDNCMKELNDEEKKDFLLYEGNAAGYRIVTKVEHNLDKGGMRLTYATLGTLLKYPWCSSSTKGHKKKKYSFFVSEKDIVADVAQKLGLIEDDDGWKRHPLAYLVEAADDICYSVLDIEDAVELGLISEFEFKEHLELLFKGSDDFKERLEEQGKSTRRRIGYIRAKAIGFFVDEVSNVFSINHDAIVNGEFEGDLISNSSGDISKTIKELKDTSRNIVFNHKSKIEKEIGSYAILGTLLENFIEAANEFKDGKESFKTKRILDLLRSHPIEKDLGHYECYMRILDYIGGMTDHYATYLAKQIGGIGIR